MNERIKLLLLKASEYALNMNPEEDSYGHPANLGKYHLDRDTKFAELIVRECAEHVEEYQPRYLTRGQASEMADSIKEHFGVENEQS